MSKPIVQIFTIGILVLLFLVWPLFAQPTSGLVAYYPMNGNANDSAANHHNGTASNCTLVTDRFGNPSGAYSFNGLDSKIELGSWMTAQYFSIGMWVKPAAEQAAYANIIDNDHSWSNGWVIQQNSIENNNMMFYVNSNPYTQTLIYAQLQSNVWQYLTVVKNNTVVRFYVNGALVSSDTCSGPALYDGSQNLVLGSHYWLDRHWAGVMDEVRIYNRTLSAAEITSLYTYNPASITVVKPNGGNICYLTLSDTIRWASNGFSGNVMIELNRNYPGTTWETLFASTTNDGSEPWIVSGVATTAARIRISSVTTSTINDISDSNFTIRDIPALGCTPSPIAFNGTCPHQVDSVLVKIYNQGNLPFQYQAITGASTGVYTNYPTNSGYQIFANDTLRIWVRFRPDSTLSYLDTLRISFVAPYTSMTIPISGLGIGYYAYSNQTTLSYNTIIEPTLRDSLSVLIRVKGNRPLQNSQWVTIPSGLPFTSPNIANINGGDSATVKIYFTPTTPGQYSGQIGLVSSAINVDTLKISVSGTSKYFPATPGNLTITRVSNDIQLNWARVDTSIHGVPVTITNYLVFFKNLQTDSWAFLAYTTGPAATSYTHLGAARFSTSLLYQVRSYISDGFSTDRVIRSLEPGMSLTEVERRLHDLSGPIVKSWQQ